MDTQGNLFNFYMDVGGERKITPVGAELLMLQSAEHASTPDLLQPNANY
jgi:hypothetical protein